MYRAAAKQILKRVRDAYTKEHTHRTVRAQDFPHLDLAFYDRTQQALQRLGFSHVADMEDETVKQQTPDPRTFLRIMTNDDGTVNAAIYHIRPAFIWRILMFCTGMRNTKLVEFQTELENRYQVMTSTVRQKDLMPSSPKIFRNLLPPRTPLPDLHQAHLDVIAKVVSEAGVQPIANRTLNEILGFENRQLEIQREYLEGIGWVTEEFLVTQSGGDKKMAKAIHAEIEKILEEERKSP